MNKKGQSLVLFICLLPLVIILFTYLFDLAYITMNKNKLNNIAYDAMNYLVKDKKEKVTIEKTILLNDNNIKIIEITDNSVHLVNEIEPIFGKAVGYKKYKLEVNLYGYIENNKLITKEKG